MNNFGLWHSETLELLKNEIIRLQSFFDNPPKDLVKELGLIPETPLTIQFGPDIDSEIRQHDLNVYMKNGEIVTPEQFGSSFFEDVSERLDSILFQSNDHTSRSVFQDGHSLELLLAPRSALGICKSFVMARDTVEQMVQERGAQISFGDGHWHASITQGEHDLMDKVLSPNADLRSYIIGGLATYQTLFPAFFIKPLFSEMYSGNRRDNPEFDGAKTISIGGPSSSICTKFHKSTIDTVEGRVAVHAPYQPVYLHMLAISYGLINKGMMPSSDQRTPFLPTHYDNPPKVSGVSGNYLDDIEETRENMKIYPGLIPKDVGEALLAESIRSYEHYLSLPHIQQMYGDEKIQDIRNELLAITEKVSVHNDQQHVLAL